MRNVDIAVPLILRSCASLGFSFFATTDFRSSASELIASVVSPAMEGFAFAAKVCAIELSWWRIANTRSMVDGAMPLYT